MKGAEQRSVEVDDLDREVRHLGWIGHAERDPRFRRDGDVVAVEVQNSVSSNARLPSAKWGVQFSSARTRNTYCQSCGTAPRSHMILTTIFCPSRSPTLRFSSRKPLATVLTESDGLQSNDPVQFVRSSPTARRRCFHALPVICWRKTQNQHALTEASLDARNALVTRNTSFSARTTWKRHSMSGRVSRISAIKSLTHYSPCSAA